MRIFYYTVYQILPIHMKTRLLLFLLTVVTAGPVMAQWTTNSQLNTAVRDQTGITEVTPLTATLADGSTYISWFESVAGTNYLMRMQRLDAAGNKLWGPDGIIVSSNPQSTALYRYDLQVDNADNAILGFQDTRTSSTSQIVVYKLSPAGAQLWGANGIQLLDPTAASGLSPTLAVTSTNNVVVTWNASGTAGSWIAMQKISPAGTLLWTAPVRLQGTTTTERYDRPFPMPVSNDEILLHYVRRTGTGLGVSTMFAQRYSAAGTGVWAAPTQVSDKTIGFAFFPAPVPDGSGGYFVAFNSGNPANANLGDVYVQRVSSTGALWSVSGTPALTGTTTTRFDGRLEYLAARNELWLNLNVRDISQGQSGISLQKFEPGVGTALLGATGLTVFPVSVTYYATQGFRIIPNGFLTVYTENTSATTSILKATKTDFAGASAWAGGPVTVSGVVSGKLNIRTGRYLNNQVVVGWEDQRLDRGIYAQNISNTGTLGPLSTRAAKPALPLTLFPNPGAAPVMQLSLARAQTVELLVQDLLGRPVHYSTVALPAGIQPVALPVSGVAAGTYFVRTTVDGQPLLGRWVKP